MKPRKFLIYALALTVLTIGIVVAARLVAAAVVMFVDWVG